MTILKKIAECSIQETANWQSNVQALTKARTDEQKALQREEKKEEKRRRQIQKRAADKAKKDAEKQAAKEKANADREAEGAGGEGEHGDDSKKGRNRTKTGQHEVTEDDPPLLHTMFKFAMGAMAVCNDVDSFLTTIAETPSVTCVARLRRGPLKKMMNVPWQWLESVSVLLFVLAWRVDAGSWQFGKYKCQVIA